MTRVLPLALLALVVAVGSGCRKEEPAPGVMPAANGKVAGPGGSKVREEMTSKMQTKQTELAASLEELKTKVSAAPAETKASMDESIKNLERMRDGLTAKLAKLKTAGSDFEMMASGVRTSLDAMEKSLAAAYAKLAPPASK